MTARLRDHTSDEMACPRIQAAWLGKLIRPGEMGVQEGGRLGVGMHDFRLYSQPEKLCLHRGNRKTYMCIDKWNFHVL